MILIELLVRFVVAKTYWVSDPDPSDPNHHADYQMQPFFKDVTVLVDVISIVPSFIYFYYGDSDKVIHDSRLNALKSVRVLRVMRLFRNSPSGTSRDQHCYLVALLPSHARGSNLLTPLLSQLRS